MTETSSHPAIFAGLLGGVAWGGAPTVALASPVDNVANAISGSLVLQFVVGCAIGAAVAGALTLIADIVARKNSDREAEDSDEESDYWRSSSLNLIKAEEEAGEDDPTGNLGRFRTGQFSIDFNALADQAIAAAVTGPRHFAQTGSRRAERQVSRPAGRHFAGNAPAPAASASVPNHMAAPGRGRHFAGNAPRPQAVVQPIPEINPVATVPTTSAAPAAELHGRARLAALPVIESHRNPVRAPHVPVVTKEVDTANAVSLGDTNDLMRPNKATTPKPAYSRARAKASNEQKLGITGRLRMQMATRTKNVRAVLAERLGTGALDGVPIITRGDGSTSEIQPTWFDQNVVPALASITGIVPRVDDTAPRMNDEQHVKRVETEAPSRASYISNRVAEVNVGVFPELRTGDELGQGDVFEQALAAMGDTIEHSGPQVSFQDVVGGPSTIDDPDGLEAPTGFIPFRVPAAHPEVVDTDTYVDYLLRDEISHIGSEVLSRSPIARLRVIEGGTGKIRTRRHPEDATPAPKAQGRHFAQQPAYAAEA